MDWWMKNQKKFLPYSLMRDMVFQYMSLFALQGKEPGENEYSKSCSNYSRRKRQMGEG